MSHNIESDHSASLGEEDLDDLTEKVKQSFTVEDRIHGLRRTTYRKCFIGSEAVQSLIDEGIAADEEDALHIGNMLLNAGVFHHVLGRHTFKNENLFYRFASDEDHGEAGTNVDGSAVSWADFLPQVSTDTGDATSLQPKIPDQDPELASFDHGRGDPAVRRRL